MNYTTPTRIAKQSGIPLTAVMAAAGRILGRTITAGAQLSADEAEQVLAEAGDPSQHTTAAESKRKTDMTIDPNDTEAFEAQCRRTWASDSVLRAEFVDSFDGYLAFARADAKGLVKIAGRRTEG